MSNLEKENYSLDNSKEADMTDYNYKISDREKKSPYFVTFMAAYGIKAQLESKEEGKAREYNQEVEPLIVPQPFNEPLLLAPAKAKKKFGIINFFILLFSLAAIAVCVVSEFALKEILAIGFTATGEPLSAIGNIKEFINILSADTIVFSNLSMGIYTIVFLVMIATTLIVSLFSLKKRGAPLYNKIALTIALAVSLTMFLVIYQKLEEIAIGGIIICALTLVMLCMAVLSPSNKPKKIKNKK